MMALRTSVELSWPTAGRTGTMTTTRTSSVRAIPSLFALTIADHRWPTGPKVPFLVGGNHEGRSRPGASDCPEGPVTWDRRCRIVANEKSIDGGTGNPRRAAMRCCPVLSILRRLLHPGVEELLEVLTSPPCELRS